MRMLAEKRNPMNESTGNSAWIVVHPLNDVPELKRNADAIGPFHLNPAARIALGALRLYLLAMMVLVAYRVADIAGAFKR
jgi:hypothetical protein